MSFASQVMWTVFSSGKNTLSKGVRFLRGLFDPDASRPGFLPTRITRKPQDPRLVELCRFIEFGKLSSGVFHDIMNPLTTILLAIEDMKTNRSLNGAAIEESLRGAMIASQRIKDVMDAAKKSLSQQATEQEFSPSKEISDAAELLGHKCRRTGTRIDLFLDQSLRMRGCPVAFFRIALNLMSNAVDSYEASSAFKTVTVHLRMRGGEIELSVRDRGCGIPSGSIDRIFDPFFSTKIGDGLGIGLSTVKALAERFGGRIRVESAKGEGARFSVSFAVSEKAAHAAFCENHLDSSTSTEGRRRLAGA